MNAHFYPGVGDPYDLTIPEFFELLGEIDDVMRRRRGEGLTQREWVEREMERRL